MPLIILMVKVFRRLLSFLAYNKPRYALLVVLIVIFSVVQNSVPYFYKIFINTLTSGDLKNIYYLLGGYVLVRLFSVFLEEVAYFVGDFILKEASAMARITIFKHVQDLDFAYHTNKSTGSLISAFKRGDGAFFQLFHSTHFRILQVFVGFLVLVYFFTQIDPLIALCAVVSFFIMLLVAKLVVGYNIKTRNIFNETEDDVSAVITDNLIGYETVKLFARENWEQKRLQNLFVTWKRHLWNHGMSYRYWGMSIGTVMNASIFLLLSMTVSLFSKKTLLIGDVVLVVGFIDSFFPRVHELVWGFREIAKSFSDIQKYFGLLDNEIEIKDPVKPVKLTSVKGEVSFKNISFSYKKGKRGAIKNFNLNIRQGQSVALVGRSGSGKTTLTKLLMRFYDVDHGQIEIDKVNIKNMNKSDLRALMGVVPQEPILFNNTIAYNIGYGKNNPTHEEITAAAKMANIDSFITTLPDKYQTNVGERGIKLSGGQKQRLAIARMILSDPDIIIFDEATSHLDSESEKLIQDAFWKAAQNKTTIIIAHRLSTITRADKIIVMDNGRIVEEGTHSNLSRNSKSLYSHFWKLQVKND